MAVIDSAYQYYSEHLCRFRHTSRYDTHKKPAARRIQ